MAVPNYSHDLTDIDLAESTTDWALRNFSGGGGAAIDFGPDLAMQGTNSVLRQVSGHERGALYTNAIGITKDTVDRHFLVWGITANPGLTANIQNRGACVLVGPSSTAVVQFHVEGNDTFGAAGRNARCYAVRFNGTAKATPPNYRTVETGANAGSVVTRFGFSNNISSSTKGLNLGIDAIRYGSGAFITQGELISAGDASDDPATFIGFNLVNDAIANRLGLLTKVGTAYELQGIHAIGINDLGTPTACKFKATDVSIAIVDCFHADPGWTRIVIDHASTRVEWTKVNIEAIGVTVKGRIVMNNASSILIWDQGTLKGIADTIFRAGASISNVTWAGTEEVTLNGATLDGCSFEELITAVSVFGDNLNDITGCSFISDGSNHAVELSSIGGGSMNWGNTLTNYVAGSSGSPVTPSSTGNEAIYVNVGSGTLTINVLDGATVPSIRSAGATVNVVAGLKTFSFTVVPSIINYEWRIYSVTAIGSLAGSVELAGEELSTLDNQSYSYSYGSDTPIAVQILGKANDTVESVTYYTLGNADQNVNINLTTDTNN